MDGSDELESRVSLGEFSSVEVAVWGCLVTGLVADVNWPFQLRAWGVCSHWKC